MSDPFEIFLAVPPGLEQSLLDEVKELDFPHTEVTPGGVTFQGTWPDVWRANLELRGATRVLARIGSLRVMHLAQLDKRAKKFDWSVFSPDVPLKVDVTCKRSRIYHAGAAKQRIEGALTAAGLTLSPEAGMSLRARIEDDLCTFSIDTSGDALHKRGHKEAVGKAPLRESLAAHFLRLCEYDGREPLVDPMCGSGTIPIEAAEIAARLAPGRSRRFAFEQLNTFDPEAMRTLPRRTVSHDEVPIFGYDRDQGAIQNATRNAERAKVSANFACQPISDLTPPTGTPGLILVNPPYGARIGNKKLLYALYGTFGQRLSAHFAGWRVGIITSDRGLAKATGLKFHDISPPIPHGGLRVHLFQAKL